MSSPLGSPAGQSSAQNAGQQGDPNSQQQHPPSTAPPLGTQPQPPAPPAAAPADKTDEPLGPAGLKALQAERERVKALEDQLKALAPLKDLAEKLGAVPPAKPEDDTAARVTQLEEALKTERDTRLRLEVANDKGLTPEQAARLVGTTKDELLADADALLKLFPTAQASSGNGTPAPPRAPAPDPTQGQRGAVDLDAQIAEAERTGNHRLAISLKRQRMLRGSK